MARIKVAVVGAGAFGRNHCRVVGESEHAELTAVVDIDGVRAQEAAAQYGARALTDARELAGMVEAAIVAVPTIAHEETGVALMEAGIDVLVEKPIAPDLAAATRLIRRPPNAAAGFCKWGTSNDLIQRLSNWSAALRCRCFSRSTG